MKKTSLDNLYAADLRRQRADALTHMAMEKIREFVHPEEYNRAARALWEMFHDKGFDVVTDEMREKAGLEPRGELGWTTRELHILENVRIVEMLKPAPVILKMPEDAR